MRFIKILSVICVCVASLAVTKNAYALWYAGNIRSSGYGAYAQIWTPATAPFITPQAGNGEYNFVTAVSASGDWVQAGWSYFPYNGFNYVRPYNEAKTGGMYWGFRFYGSQAWNTTIKYTVENSTSNCWKAYWPAVGDGDAWCGLTTPTQVEALLEVQGSTSNVANTKFRKVHYKQSSGAWVNFDQASWLENSPYKIQDKSYLYKWDSVGP